MGRLFLIFGFCAVASVVAADPPVIEAVEARREGDGWRFDVTIRHADSGWDHYADGWHVLGPDGQELGLRVLHHPHVEEQPFTRSLGGVVIPEGLDVVQIGARCSVDGWTAAPVTVSLR